MIRSKSGKSKRFMGKYDHKKRDWLRLAIQIVIVIILSLLVLNTIVGLSRIDGQSMCPTLNDNQRVFFLRIGNDYKPGDIVAIKMPNGDKYVKRIIATEGDEIDIRDGFVYKNGKMLSENYIYSQDGSTLAQNERIQYPYTVEEGCYWVMGDNREESIDSRSFGQIVEDNIKGKLLFIK